MPFPYINETKFLNDGTRRAAPGLFARLPDGVTHYRLEGLPEGPLIVLVHGFSVPSFIFDLTAAAFTEAGFRVLRFDLFGRGWSDRPNVAYTLDLFVRQLRDLLDSLRISPPLDLLGLSMGGPITAAFTVRHPQYVRKHVMVDPASVHAVELGWLKAGTTPIVGELFLGLFGGENMVKGIASDFFHLDNFQQSIVERLTGQYRTQMQFSGFKRAILSTLRNGILGDQSAIYRQLGALHKPTLLIWGKDDATVPFEHSADLRSYIPHAQFLAVEHCGHVPLLERPAEVNPALVEFLK